MTCLAESNRINTWFSTTMVNWSIKEKTESNSLTLSHFILSAFKIDSYFLFGYNKKPLCPLIGGHMSIFSGLFKEKSE